MIQQECRLADISQPLDAWSDAPPNAGVKRGWVGVGGVDHVHRLSFDLYLWSSFIGTVEFFLLLATSAPLR